MSDQIEDKNFFNTLEEGQCKGLCDSGKCSAECCGCVNIYEPYFRRLKHLIPDGKEYYPVKIKEGTETFIKPMTKNFKCVFLSDSNSCLIYNSHLRPEYCKRFGEDPTEPLFACTHINPETKEVIEDFCKTYLEGAANAGNVIAKHLLDRHSIETSKEE